MSRRISLRSILFDTPIIEKMTLGSSAFAIRPLKRPRGKPQAPGPPRLLERQEDARPLVLPPISEKMTLASAAFATRPLKRPGGKPQAPGPPRLLERQEDARPLVLPRRVRALRKEEAFGRDVARVDQAVSHALGAF